MIVWIVFIVFVLIFLASKEAGIWTAIWVTVAFSFSGVIYWLFNAGLIDNPTGLTPNTAVIKYITGYLIELSLSVDNVFVIAVIFGAFKIPPLYQHRVLFWGILGAIVFRALMIFFGVALITKFEWIIYIFGIFLLYTAFKMLKGDENDFDPKNSFVFKQIKKIYPITATIQGHAFFVKRLGVNAATPLFVALIVIEITDILFAFVGLKMLFSHYVELPEWISLTVISVALASGVLTSMFIKEKE